MGPLILVEILKDCCCLMLILVVVVYNVDVAMSWWRHVVVLMSHDETGQDGLVCKNINQLLLIGDGVCWAKWSLLEFWNCICPSHHGILNQWSNQKSINKWLVEEFNHHQSTRRRRFLGQSAIWNCCYVQSYWSSNLKWNIGWGNESASYWQ